MPYRIIYSPAAEDHLRQLTARQQAMLLDAVEAQLVHQPAIVTRNRKLLRGNATAAWELRIGVLRVYYDVDEDPEPTVAIQAIGIKKRDRVYVGGRLADL